MMKTKYVMNGGLAFSEKKDVEKLEKLASKGWLFREFVYAGFLYKLEQGPKQDLAYTFDFQSSPDDDYFKMFSSAGWTHVTSSGDHVHVFSAPKGTAPIYSGDEVEEGKYKDITTNLGKGALYSFVFMVVLLIVMAITKSKSILLLVLLGIDLIAFVFCFMPYVAYKIKTD